MPDRGVTPRRWARPGLQYICAHDRVRFATGEEIVRHGLQSGAIF
jgi:hypothetical protein